MILIIHLLVCLMLVTSGYTIYWRCFRFNRNQLLNKIVKDHLNRIKEGMLNDRYIDYKYEIGHTNSIDNQIIEKIMNYLINKGFVVNVIFELDERTYLTIK